MTSLVERLLPDALWQRIQPLLPPPRPRGGVPRRLPDRNCVAALIFMARTSTPWVLLPAKELRCGSATTCWRRLDGWARAGVFEQLQALLPDELGAAGRVDLERVSVDSFSLRALKGWELIGANPVDRGKAGSKLHLAGDAGGLPLSLIVSAANTGDATMFEAVLDDIPPIRMPTGQRRRRPAKVHADKAYDHRRCRAYVRRRGIRRGSPAAWSSPRLGLAATGGRSSGPGLAGRLPAAAHPLRALLGTLLCPGDAGVCGDLLLHPPAATVVTVVQPGRGSVSCNSGPQSATTEERIVAYLTIHRLNGDPDDLLHRKQTHFDPVTSRLAPNYGAIFSVTAKTVDGLVIVNLWESPQAPVRFAQVPEVLQAQQASGLPEPSHFERYQDAHYDRYDQARPGSEERS